MDKYFVIIILVVLAAIIAGIVLALRNRTKKGGDDPEALARLVLPNPLRRAESLDAVNSAVGCRMPRIGGATDESFTVIASKPPLGWYSFTLEGTQFHLRAGRTEDDLTGVYLAGGTLTDLLNGERETGPREAEEFTWLRRFDGDMQYALWAANCPRELFDRAAEAVSAIWEAGK